MKGPRSIESNRTNPLDELVVVPDLMRAMQRSLDVSLAYQAFMHDFDADKECEHGNVPGTRPARCDCFTQSSPGRKA